MKIAFFTDTYLPNTDGVVRVLLLLKEELEKKGHEVYVFAPGSSEQKKKNKDPKVHYFTSARFSPYPDYRIALFPFLSAVRLVKDLKIDIIHSHGIATTGLAAIQSAKKLKIPSIATFHTLVPEATHYLTKNKDWQKTLGDVAWKYLRWYYSHFDKVLTPSEFMRKILKEHGIESQTLPHGIRFHEFNSKGNREKFREKYRLKSKRVILYVGRMVAEKGIEMLINGMSTIVNRVPNAKLVLVGKGPYKEKLEELAEKLKGNILFTGFIPDEELYDAYKGGDIFAFPSEFDTQGLSVLEAMASGLPPVVKKGTAPAELIENKKNGVLFDGPMDLPEALEWALNNKEKLQEEAIRTAKRYDIKNTANELNKIYESMINQGKESQ